MNIFSCNELRKNVNQDLNKIKFISNISKNNISKIVDDKAKEIAKDKKKAINLITGGYKSYNKNICVLGSLTIYFINMK